ncbi:MAG: hypothetical protein NTU73_09285 [Ignavibacteriae bacterium]|nr:hypothetical protein [Ignavibacteriota bacterium]
MDGRIYKYKLDFYYKSVIVYMLFLILYVTINGTLFARQITDLYKDPIIYISLIFILFTFFVLIKNAIRAKEIIFEDDKFIIRNRFGQREVLFSDILIVKFSREKKYGSNRKGNVRRVRMKLKERKRYLRIRLSEFWEEKKLISEFKNIVKLISTRV